MGTTKGAFPFGSWASVEGAGADGEPVDILGLGRGTLTPKEASWVLGLGREPESFGQLPNGLSCNKAKPERQCPISSCNLSNVFMKLLRSRLSPKNDLRAAVYNAGELETATLPPRSVTVALPDVAKPNTKAVFTGKAFIGAAVFVVAIFDGGHGRNAESRGRGAFT